MDNEKCLSDLEKINPEQIAFIGFVEGGSMGRAGDITFIDTDRNVYTGNHIFHGKNAWYNCKKFIPITNYFYMNDRHFDEEGLKLLDEAGYTYQYLGDGSHLVFKKIYLEMFKERTDSFLLAEKTEIDLGRCKIMGYSQEISDERIQFEFNWEETALEIIEAIEKE